jgi:hypothetical protein
MYYMGFTYREAYSLPVWQRKWFIERVVEEIKNSNGQTKTVNSPDDAAKNLMGQGRAGTPARLRRFT